MRGRVSLITRNIDFVLPYSYPYQLASSLYKALARVAPDRAAELHERQHFKFFTFSWLQFPRRRSTPVGLQVSSRYGQFFISSPDEQLFRELMQGLLETSAVQLGGQAFEVQGISVLGEEPIRTGDWFSTLSPILLRIDQERASGEMENAPRVWDVLPNDSRFPEQLSKNLIRKFQSFYGYAPKGTLTVQAIRRVRPKRIAIRNTWHRAAHLIFRLAGNKDLLQFGYQCGFGERNSLGFGMVRYIQDPKSTPASGEIARGEQP